MDELAKNNLVPVGIGGGMTSTVQPTDTRHLETVQMFKERQKKVKERAEQIRVERAEQIRVERQMTKERAEQIWRQMEDELPLCVVDSFTPILQMQDEIPLWVSSQTEEETDLKQAEEKTTDGHEHEGGEEQTQTGKKKQE